MVQHATHQLPEVMEVLRDYERSLEDAANLAITLSSSIRGALHLPGDAFRNESTTLAGLDAMEAILASFGSIASARENLQAGIRHISTMRRGLNKPALESVRKTTEDPGL